VQKLYKNNEKNGILIVNKGSDRNARICL